MQEPDILDDAVLHERLCLSACILAELLQQSPEPVDERRLADIANHPLEQVEKACARMARGGLLRPHAPGQWALAVPPSSISLADLFAVLIPDQGRNVQ